MSQIEVDGVTVTVVRRKIKSLNLYVKPPDGRVQVSAPMRTSDRAIRGFVQAHIAWVHRQQARIRDCCPRHAYQSGETISVFGKPYVLLCTPAATKRACGAALEADRLVLASCPDSTAEQREEILRRWQRDQLKTLAAELIAQWEGRMGVRVSTWHIKRMKTKWGSCNFRAHRIWLNLSLAEQPVECVEYVVVHELCHLLEPSHNERFWALMTQYLPDWKARRTRLNAAPKKPDAALP